MGGLSKGQTVKNFSSNILYFIINIVLGILLVPFFIDKLGIAAYAVIPLATSLIGYIGLLTNSLNNAISRHLTIDLQSPDGRLANRTFNSAFFGISKIILFMVPIVIIVSFLAPPLFSVPDQSQMDAAWLFLGIGLAFLLRSWSSCFSVILYAANRLDLINFINLSNVVTQVLFIVVLFLISTPMLVSVGIAYLLGAGVATIITVVLFRSRNERLSIDHNYYDIRKYREMAQMGGWIIINDIGALLLLNIDLIVVNYLFGNAVGGEYAIAFQWVSLFRGMVGTFISILGPIILISYANGQMEKIISISKSAVKLTGVGIALPIGLLCGLAPLILTYWVGEEYADLAPLMVLLTSHLVINTAVIPLFQINVAYNKVRLPAIVTLITGICNICLAFILAAPLGLGIYGIAAASLISLTMKNVIFTPIYASMVLGISRSTFYPAVLPGAIAALSISMISFVTMLFVPIPGLVVLIIISVAIAATYGLVVWKAVLNDDEKSIVSIKWGST